MDIKGISSLLSLSNLANESDLLAVSEKEISDFESVIGLDLPKAYTDLLKAMGNGAGKFAIDCDFFLHQIKTLKGEVEEMIEEEGLNIDLPENIFFFIGYQGFQYHFFKCNESDDPEVYRLMDGGSPPEKVANSFSEFITKMIKEYNNIN